MDDPIMPARPPLAALAAIERISGFRSWTPLAFSDWDADQNSELSQDEFDEGAWSSFDADASGSLSMDEANSISEAIR